MYITGISLVVVLGDHWRPSDSARTSPYSCCGQGPWYFSPAEQDLPGGSDLEWEFIVIFHGIL